ncbi:thiazole biosynthesis protein ThiH [Pseudodesulfovibrio mercurii]|uniref:Thiazole biosynthesis protein ThiH n=1 Tax=Pseudodesulfovibrio mercurii TaxID=641491 RepID=F0JHM1_9BACT|nr:2-iminoacetate synthase ThiH [Pseudodesulfovibrio mercurii]EGB14081.1 thiazole biosynthesis protein ThiH [Pseudodesulfovibrio mercurii]
MSFYPLIETYAEALPDARFDDFTEEDVRRALNRTTATVEDFMALMSPAASTLLEEMARKASGLTVQHFGRTVSLFTPLYLANICTNHCVYCGFNCTNKIHRSMLSLEEVDVEGAAIAATGLKNLLILTGDAPAKTGVDYLEACTRVLNKHFPSVSIEVFALTGEEYARLVKAGVDGMTMFQETYDEELYAVLHPKGPKRDYRFRLDAPERACRAGMRVVNIGALLGLGDWRRDALLTGLHAAYLMHRYPETDIAVSLPRMRPHVGDWEPKTIVSDKDMVQFLMALRIFLPRVGITISTRENAEFRENILPLGVTRMSAGVSTAVGGHSAETSDEENTGQFDISDARSVDEVCAALRLKGYQPVFKDWEPIFETSSATMEGA